MTRLCGRPAAAVTQSLTSELTGGGAVQPAAGSGRSLAARILRSQSLSSAGEGAAKTCRAWETAGRGGPQGERWLPSPEINARLRNPTGSTAEPRMLDRLRGRRAVSWDDFLEAEPCKFTRSGSVDTPKIHYVLVK